MRTSIATAATAILGCIVLAGCSTVGGTWKTAPGQASGPVSFGSMTLANDGTFTAEAKYGNETKVMTGYYEYTGDHMIFTSDGKSRSYKADLANDTLVLTHENNPIVMNRIPSKSKADQWKVEQEMQANQSGSSSSPSSSSTDMATGQDDRPNK